MYWDNLKLYQLIIEKIKNQTLNVLIIPHMVKNKILNFLSRAHQLVSDTIFLPCKEL